jgi:hypothetical protein
MKYPNLLSAEAMIAAIEDDTYTICYDGNKWHHARPLGYQSLWSRIYCAWLVFTGKADAVIWPGNQ